LFILFDTVINGYPNTQKIKDQATKLFTNASPDLSFFSALLRKGKRDFKHVFEFNWGLKRIEKKVGEIQILNSQALEGQKPEIEEKIGLVQNLLSFYTIMH
jgi:hypothetical protein